MNLRSHISSQGRTCGSARARMASLPGARLIGIN
jgi:hypothetical protein